MGYEVEEKAFKLKFEDRPGMEVIAGSLELGEFLEVTKLAGVDASEATQHAEQLFTFFADALISWNLTKKGEPVPTTLAGIKTLYFDFALEIVLAWIKAMGEVDNPLPKGLNGGGTALESTMPMNPSS